jgi:hypothetical protein
MPLAQGLTSEQRHPNLRGRVKRRVELMCSSIGDQARHTTSYRHRFKQRKASIGVFRAVSFRQ